MRCLKDLLESPKTSDSDAICHLAAVSREEQIGGCNQSHDQAESLQEVASWQTGLLSKLSRNC